MFADAIENVSGFTKPILFISKGYKSFNIIPGSATMFFVNNNGVAVTCKHVAEAIINADRVNKRYQEFKNNRAALESSANKKEKLKALEKQYDYRDGVIVNQKCNFVDCVAPIRTFTVHFHEKLDLAIIEFKDFDKKFYTGHAVFAKDSSSARPGDFLCRIGYPFPEFNSYNYNHAADDIEWSSVGNTNVPRFPQEGMVTRYVGDENNNVIGIELSTPGFKGHSGGPLFDKDGLVYGMQFATRHLHMGFDINNANIMINGKEELVNNQPFLHVGNCITGNLIKEFLDRFNIEYFEA